MADFLYRLMNTGSVWDTFMEAVPFTCVVGLLYAILRLIGIKCKKRPVRWGTELIRLLFVCYLAGLFSLVLLPANFWSDVFFFLANGYPPDRSNPLFTGEFNFIPILVKYILGTYGSHGGWVRDMLFGNLLMFVPFGLFLPFVTKRINRRNIFLLAAIVPLAIELIQPVIGRSFDVDDLLLNFAGILVGYFAVLGARRFAKRRQNSNPQR